MYHAADPPWENPVKPETTRGAPRLLPGLEPADRLEPTARARSSNALDGDFDPVDFAEFVEPDDRSLPIDPIFEERLREQLWGMVCDRAGSKPSKRPRFGS